MIIEKNTDISWTWFVLHFAHEDANILQVPFSSVGNSALLEVCLLYTSDAADE